MFYIHTLVHIHCIIFNALFVDYTMNSDRIYVLTKSNNEYNGRRWKCTPLSLILTVFPHCLHWNTYYILIYLMKKMQSERITKQQQFKCDRSLKKKKNDMKKCIHFAIVFDYIALVIPLFVFHSFISSLFSILCTNFGSDSLDATQILTALPRNGFYVVTCTPF